jgi:translation initiation factor 3 subunit C
MQSKFWGKNSDSEESEDEYSSSEEETTSDSSSGYSDESSDVSSDDSSDSDSEGSGKGASRFLMGSSDSESEEERRVVKSAKAKASEELVNICNEIRGNMDSNEWAAIQTLWDKLHKQVDKIKKTTGMLGTPRPYVKIITELEDFLNQTLEGMCYVVLCCDVLGALRRVLLRFEPISGAKKIAVPAGFEPARVAPKDVT